MTTHETQPGPPTNTGPQVNRPWVGLDGVAAVPDARFWTRFLRAGFDVETTGKDPKAARIVTASLVLVDGQDGQVVDAYEWLVDPGVQIPAEAAAVHGVSTERARAEGMDTAAATAEITAALAELMAAGVPVVAFNAPYDFTVLDREAGRHGVTALEPSLVLDPYVMDKDADRYRKGSRTLSAVCTHYGVELLEAHTSAADALAAVRIADAITRRFPSPWMEKPSVLQNLQTRQKGQQAESLQLWFRRKDPEAIVDGCWPFCARGAH